MPRPPEDRSDTNPWPTWPVIFRVDYGHEEAAAKYGSDPRVYSVSGKAFVRDENGSLLGINTVEVDQNFQEIPDTEKFWPADLVLLSMGFLGLSTISATRWGSSWTRAPTTRLKAASSRQRIQRSLPLATVAAVNHW